MERTAKDLRIGSILFFILFAVWMSGATIVVAQSLDAIDATQNASIAHITEDLERMNSDIRALTATVNELAASVNRFTGIGIAIGALGGVIVILQSLQFVRKRNGQ